MNDGTALVIGIFAYVLLAGAIVNSGFVNYTQNGLYEIDQAREWLWRARATNDLVDMSKYLNKTLDLMKPYNGNPNWWFPKPDTDFTLIKDNIKECVANCLNFQNEDDMAYQQAVHNLQETIIEIEDHLSGARECKTFNLGFFVWLIIAVILLFVMWLPLILM